MNLFARFFIIVAGIIVGAPAFANHDSCQKMIYKDGWLKSYKYKGNTLKANTQKSGLLTSIGGSLLETTTASVDPGVSTGSASSTVQYTSSWGECAGIDLIYTKNFRRKYIEQNMLEIKKEIAQGGGNHVITLAYLSGCEGSVAGVWESHMQTLTPDIYDLKDGASIDDAIIDMVGGTPGLSARCHFSKN